MLCVCNEKLKYPATVKKTAVHSATEYIKDNFIYDITLKDIANAAHLSPMYLRELFVKEMKMSPHEYIIKKRIGKAKELLALNVQTISEVATLSGFSSQSYFDYIFKKRTGMTPKQFKAKNNELYFK